MWSPINLKVDKISEANKKFIELLSKEYKVAKTKIRIVKGETGKNKVVEIDI